MPFKDSDSVINDPIIMPARLCGYVGQTVLIFQDSHGTPYCNYQKNNGCDEGAEGCRLRMAREKLS